MENEVRFLYLDDIIPNRFQPRENFDEQALKELAVSIKEHGVIQPIVVRQIGDKYEIIAGERRYKASTMAGLTKIPAIIKNLDDKESSKVALIENLQRKDLTPIEEARTYQKILELDALTQEELARTMGKSQSAVSNKLRLLSLTDEVQDALLHEQISERHARSLLNVTDKAKQVELLNRVINSRMTVRELDQEIKQLNGEVIIEKENRNEEEVETLITEPKDILINDQIGVSNIVEERIENSSPINMGNLFMPTINNDIVEDEQKVETLEAEKEYKEDIIGGSGLLAGMSVSTPLNQINNEKVTLDQTNNDIFGGLYQNFNDKIEEKNKEPEIFINKSDKLETLEVDSNSVINSVKESINKIKSNNKNIEMEEFDFDDFYQLVIRIDKNQ